VRYCRSVDDSQTNQFPSAVRTDQGAFLLDRPYGDGQSEELLECLVSDVDGGGFPELVFRDMKEVTTEVFFTGRVGFGPDAIGKLSEHAYVGLMSGFPVPVNLEIMLESNSDRKLGFQVFGHDDNLSGRSDPWGVRSGTARNKEQRRLPACLERKRRQQTVSPCTPQHALPRQRLT